jgi:LysM repeat protein
MLSIRVVIFVLLIALTGCNLTATSPGQVAIIVTSPPTLVCNDLVNSAIETAINACIELESGDACFGHRQVMAEFYPDSTVQFNFPGDTADLATISRMNTSALSEAAQTWGLTVIKTSIQQQEVMFVLFGDATLEGITPDMSEATLQTGSKGVSCAPLPAMLIQTPEDSQVTIALNGVDITLGSTVHIIATENQTMAISTLEGTAVVAAFNATRIVRSGAQVDVPLDGLSARGAPSSPVPYDIASLQGAPLALLDRVFQLSEPIAGATIPPVGSTLTTSTTPSVTIPTAGTPTTTCTVRSDWTATYTVQRGDTLSTIARRYGIDLREFQEGNCITNPDLIRAGQELRVPDEPATDIPSTAPTNSQAPTPTTAIFRADQSVLAESECTIIRWDVDNVTTVAFEDKPTTPHDSQEVCPTETTSYRLTVTHPDGREIPYTLRIEVVAATEESG